MASQALIVLLFSWSCATADYFVSSNLHPRFDYHMETVDNTLAILKGDPMMMSHMPFEAPQLQSRVMFPLAMRELMRIGLQPSPAFIVLRYLTAWIGFAVFLTVALTLARSSPKAAGIGALMIAFGFIFTFNFAWEQSTDFLDLVFVSLLVGLALRRERIWLFVAVLVGTFNHQTVAFASVIWLCLWGRGRWIREGLYATALVVACYALSTALKMYFGTTPSSQSLSYVVDGWRTIGYLKYAMTHLTPTQWPVLLGAMWVPITCWLALHRRTMPAESRALVTSAIAMIVIGTPIAFWSEIRSVFLMPYIVATFAAAIAETKSATAL